MAELTHPDASPQDENNALEKGAIEHWPRGIAYDGGFRILGTPLGFGNAKSASLRFVSFVDGNLPKRGTRVLLSPFVAAAIDAEGRGLDALHLGFDRKIRLGRMDIRMLPTGLGPGSSQIEITLKNKIVIYTDGVRLAQPLTAPGALIPSCDLLLLDVKPAQPNPPSPRTISSKLTKWINDVLEKGKVSVLCAGSRGAVLDAAWILKEMDVEIRAQRSLFEMLKRIESAGYAVPKLRRLEQEFPKSGIVLHLADILPTWNMISDPSVQTAFIGPGREKPQWADAGFRLAETEDRPGLVSYVKQTGAGDVALGPSCDDAMEKLLVKAGLNVYRLRNPKQMDLDI